MGEYVRARSAQQKAERMSEIMDTVEELYREVPYHEITMQVIAERTGWSRSNLYRYASSVEEFFLALHNRANRKYFDDLTGTLPHNGSDAEFADAWATVTGRHSEFLRYQEILTAIIESNVSMEKLVEFKCSFRKMLTPVVEHLQRQTGCSELESVNLYLRLIYQAPALYAQYHFSKRTCEAMEAAGLPCAEGTFEGSYSAFVIMCLEAERYAEGRHGE